MVPSWLIIGGIGFSVALLVNTLNTSSEDRLWFNRLRRPQWLTFEWAIPLIWIFIFVCTVFSASLVWESAPGTNYVWVLMAIYLLLELSIFAYTPVMCKFRSLTVGTIIGGTGFVIGLILSIMVSGVSTGAFYLLVPYLLWSPVGTFVTWQMIFLNPGNG